MKTTFLCSLHGLKITDHVNIDKINERLCITKNKEKIKSFISSDHREIMGKMEYSYLTSGSPVIFSTDHVPSGIDNNQHIISLLYEIQAFLTTYWIVQDNSVNTELAFLLTENFVDKYKEDRVTSNFLGNMITKSNGLKEEISLSRSNLQKVRTLFRERFSNEERTPFKFDVTQLTSKNKRIPRAIYMINEARCCPDVAMKVADYCTAFETLFSTATSELSHQLSERIACYLHANGNERLFTYRELKKAYNLRSTVVHGSTLKESKMSSAIDLSIYCDKIARSLINKIISNEAEKEMFELDSQDFDEAMYKIIFAS